MKVVAGVLLSGVLLAALGIGSVWPNGFAARAAEGSVQEQIVAHERKELDALRTGDKQAFSDLLADDALFLDPRGTGTKAEVVSHVSDFRLVEYLMEDIRFVSLSDHSGLIAYKLTEKGSAHGREFSAKVYASAIWAKRGEQWVCIFSQETPARETPAK